MADESPEQDSDIRRRAAWLLAMLALVAGLFVALMVTFFNTSGGSSDDVDDLAGPTDAVAPTSTPARTPGSSSTPGPGASGSSSSASGSSTPSGLPTGGKASCPGDDPCALDADIGSAAAAVNVYRAENHRKAVPVSISAAAKKCALSNGSNCSGGWAETQVPGQDGRADGKAAVAKIQQFGNLLGGMKSLEIGWAYDPGSEQFYFAIIRKD